MLRGERPGYQCSHNAAESAYKSSPTVLVRQNVLRVILDWHPWTWGPSILRDRFAPKREVRRHEHAGVGFRPIVATRLWFPPQNRQLVAKRKTNPNPHDRNSDPSRSL